MADFTLRSDGFEDGGAIPRQFTCDGEDLSPALSWSEPPPGTQGFALVLDDPDAPSGTFRHWGAWNIDGESRGIAQGSGSGSGAPFEQARNDFGRSGYGGPCPPPGHGPHRYRFRLFALDVRELQFNATPTVAELEQEAKRHSTGRAELTGTYERK